MNSYLWDWTYFQQSCCQIHYHPLWILTCETGLISNKAAVRFTIILYELLPVRLDSFPTKLLSDSLSSSMNSYLWDWTHFQQSCCQIHYHPLWTLTCETGLISNKAAVRFTIILYELLPVRLDSFPTKLLSDSLSSFMNSYLWDWIQFQQSCYLIHYHPLWTLTCETGFISNKAAVRFTIILYELLPVRLNSIPTKLLSDTLSSSMNSYLWDWIHFQQNCYLIHYHPLWPFTCESGLISNKAAVRFTIILYELLPVRLNSIPTKLLSDTLSSSMNSYLWDWIHFQQSCYQIHYHPLSSCLVILIYFCLHFHLPSCLSHCLGFDVWQSFLPVK